MDSKEGYVSADVNLNDLVGKDAITLSFLRPSGKVRIGDHSYTAISDIGFIEKGSRVKVIGSDGISLRVRKIEK